MCKTKKQAEKNISTTKTYTISEAKFVKFVILAICDDVADGFNEFELFEENNGYIKQIIGQIYGKDAGYTNKILELVDLIPEIGKKYLSIAALYEEIMLKKDITSAILIFEFIRKFKLLNSFLDLDDSSQKNIEVMLKVLEMLIFAYAPQNDTHQSNVYEMSSMPPLTFVCYQQDALKEMQENVNKLKTEVLELEELKSKIDLDKITLAIDYTSAQAQLAIKKEKEMINEWDQQLTLWKENGCNFGSTLKIVNQLGEIENNVFPHNKKRVAKLKLSIPDDIRIFACWPTTGIKLKNEDGYYMHSSLLDRTLVLLSTIDFYRASDWIFETNANGEGVFIKSLNSQAYLYADSANHSLYINIVCEKSSIYFLWTLEKISGTGTYDIINMGTKLPIIVTDNGHSYKNWQGIRVDY